MNEQMPKIVNSRLASLEIRPDEVSHPDADLLAAFVERGLPESQQGDVLRHLAQCADCRSVVALAQPAGVEPQAILVAPTRVLARGIWRWGALAACAVLAVSVLLHKRESRWLAVARLQASSAAVSRGKPSPAVRNEAEIYQSQNTQAVIAGALPAERRVAPLSLEPSAPLQDATGKDASVGIAGNAGQRSDDVAARQGLSAANVPGSLREQPLEGQTAAPESKLGDPSLAAVARPGSAARARAVAPPPEIGSADPKSDSPQAEVAPQAGVAKQAELAKKEADGKRGQPLDSKAKSYDQLAAKQAAELDATGAAVAPLARAATPYAPTDKDEFRASSSQMANVGSLTSARQVATWQMTEAGNLQRSFDGGKSWESVSVGQPVRLRVVAAIGFHIWAGGNGGLLFHSRDGGNSFSVVRVGREHSTLGGDIVTLAFPDAQHGRLETSAHEVWTSSDGGQSWVGSFPAK